MTDPVRLSVMTPIGQSDSSSQHSSFTLTNDSHDELLRKRPIGCSSCLDPSQTACQHMSDHYSPTSSGMRLPTLSYENSDDEDSHGPIGDPGTGTRESVDSNREESIPARGRSRITNVPQHLRNGHHGKLLNKLWNHPHFQPETVTEPSKSAMILRLWKWEIFNCVLAIGMLGSMYSILLHYNGQRTPDWGTTINLSTLIALMATLLRTMLAFVVSEIIGQAKWDYFAGGVRKSDSAPVRRLIETSRFNEASQGMLGAVKLLPTIILDPATLTAVMVLIVSLGTGSFVQQAIQTQSCQFPVDSVHASLPVTRNLSELSVQSIRSSYLFATVSSALAPESEDIGSAISVGCLTGNCTFRNSIGGMYSTLGMCSSCVDASSLITSTEQQCTPGVFCEQSIANVTLPNGMSTYNMTKYINTHATQILVSPTGELDWASDLTSQGMKALSSLAMENVTILAPKLLPTSPKYSEFVAVSCTLYPCLRSYTSEVRSGELDEVLRGTVPAVPNIVDQMEQYFGDFPIPGDKAMEMGRPLLPSPSQVVQSPCLVNGTVWAKENKSSTLDLQDLIFAYRVDTEPGAYLYRFEGIKAPAECIYSWGGTAVNRLLETMEGLTFNGSCDIWVEGANEIAAWNYTGSIDCGEEFWLASFLDGNEITADSITKRIQAFTDRLSNKMRMGFLNDPEIVYGQVLQATVCSRIHYSWLAFPLALVVLTIGLLAWTMFWSSRRRGRVMVWKTSILPFLFYSERFGVQNGEDISADSTESMRRDEGAKEPLLDLDQMEKEARQRKVCFDLFN